MILLSNVSLSLRENGPEAAPVLRDVTVALPTNRRVAILGTDPREMTEVLSMLAGMRKPDAGWVDRGDIRCSPVVNAGSTPGRTLVPTLSAMANIRLAASANAVDEVELIALVESACQFGKLLRAPVNNLDRAMRRKLEATLIAAIPYDCYYIDRLHEFEAPIIWQFVQVAKRRGAGILFTSRMPKQVRKFAELGAMIGDGSLEMRDYLAKAPAPEAV
jgi:capsular polysaccharide transport system ATP-binding protein